MRSAKFIAIICCATPCSVAHAAFVNITIENENALFENHPNIAVRNAWIALGGQLDVYRIYANFDNNNTQDHVFNVFGNSAMPSFLSSNDGAFFNYTTQNPKGGVDHYNWPVWPGFYSQSPQLAWDTFATLGFGQFFYQGGWSGSMSDLDNLQENWLNTTISWHYGVSHPEEGDAVAGGPSPDNSPSTPATASSGATTPISPPSLRPAR